MNYTKILKQVQKLFDTDVIHILTKMHHHLNSYVLILLSTH